MGPSLDARYLAAVADDEKGDSQAVGKARDASVTQAPAEGRTGLPAAPPDGMTGA